MIIETAQVAGVAIRIATCPRPVCGHQWSPNVDRPKCCPKCKQYIRWQR